MARSIESGRLSVRLREALMARLLAGDTPAGGQAEDGAAPDPVPDLDDLCTDLAGEIKALR